MREEEPFLSNVCLSVRPFVSDNHSHFSLKYAGKLKRREMDDTSRYKVIALPNLVKAALSKVI